jgi:alcohol dehydrogenase
MSEINTFQIATQIKFGFGAIQTLGSLAQEHAVEHAFLVTDPGLIKAGVHERIIAALRDFNIKTTIFSDVEANPSIQTTANAFQKYTEEACDGVIALGGGSPMDAAKGIAILATNPGTIHEYVGIGKVKNDPAPLIAIPTTVGTGSEVTTFAVLTDTTQRRKVVIGSPRVAPAAAILDPDLVASLPQYLVAYTGMDALTHAVESVVSNFATTFTDALALQAIRMVSNHLPAAVNDKSQDARAELLYASTMAGMAFSFARTGLVHGMAHPLSSYYNLQHGLANAILLCHVMDFNAPSCAEKLLKVAVAMGQEATPEAAIKAIQNLGKQVGIPEKLSEAGVTSEFIPLMAEDAFNSGNAQLVNPRKPTLEEVLSLYNAAL